MTYSTFQYVQHFVWNPPMIVDIPDLSNFRFQSGMPSELQKTLKKQLPKLSNCLQVGSLTGFELNEYDPELVGPEADTVAKPGIPKTGQGKPCAEEGNSTPGSLAVQFRYSQDKLTDNASIASIDSIPLDNNDEYASSPSVLDYRQTPKISTHETNLIQTQESSIM
ncbi:unnamed protein product [Ambrosiozyma monospora]|uniref:Unnamed protein product n=1 Tax=Ambrosiozyma monospora TaxID=43982 RepID=A0ACB5SSE6_AMBMO|nr:unnamed protein product [Ambrosiozyma monospora]